MKIINFANMMKVLGDVIFCQVDVADNFKMGPLCQKVDNDSESSFRYIQLGVDILVNSYDELGDLSEEVSRDLETNGVSGYLAIDYSEIRSDSGNELINYVIYNGDDLDLIINELEAGKRRI